MIEKKIYRQYGSQGGIGMKSENIYTNHTFYDDTIEGE